MPRPFRHNHRAEYPNRSALVETTTALTACVMILVAGGCETAGGTNTPPPASESAAAKPQETQIIMQTPAGPTPADFTVPKETVIDNNLLRTALLDLMKRDQEAREALIQAMQEGGQNPDGSIRISNDVMLPVKSIDAESTAFLQTMVEHRGWPGVSDIGEDGAHAAWILAQHADDHPEFQRQILGMMEPLVPAGEVIPKHFALLTDRVLVAAGEPQEYGTQFTGGADRVFRPNATRDWENIDERRASVGLGPMAEYAEALIETYGGEVDLTPIDLIKEDQ